MKTVCAVLVSVILCGCAITDFVKVKPPVIEPPVITLPTTTTTTQPPVATCGCGTEKSDYIRRVNGGRDEQQCSFYGLELRCIINDNQENESSITQIVVDSKCAKIVDGKLYVSCFVLPDGSKAHYVGYKQPSSSSPLVSGQGNAIGNGLLRLFFVSRRGASVVTPVEPTPDANGNNPSFDPNNIPSDWSTDSSRVYDGRLCKAGEYGGTVKVCDKPDNQKCANVRYRLRSHFEHDLKLQTGYANKGQINITATGDGKSVSWSVL